MGRPGAGPGARRPCILDARGLAARPSAVHPGNRGRISPVLQTTTPKALIWAVKLAREHSQADVVSTDPSLIQPEQQYLPDNVSLIGEDIEDDDAGDPEPRRPGSRGTEERRGSRVLTGLCMLYTPRSHGTLLGAGCCSGPSERHLRG